jgi:hypothetical protein
LSNGGAARLTSRLVVPLLAASAPTRGMLTRAAKGVWNSRLQYAGDFESLSAALAAIEGAFPEIRQIRCYEYTVDDEYPVEIAPSQRSGDKWRPAHS